MARLGVVPPVIFNMKLYPENIYHIYNRGNNKQKIFFNRENYLFFLKKIREHLKPHLKFISYCLMPNHFHFLALTPYEFNAEKFSDKFKTLLSSYTRAINIKEKRTGSLFQQNSKAKCLTDSDPKGSKDNYGLICFKYIHQNPLKAGLVRKIEDWEFSSFNEYIGKRVGTLCKKELAFSLLELPTNISEFYKFSYESIKEEKLEKIF